jgi:glycosyltransferase involved in cell wall biosynthesis
MQVVINASLMDSSPTGLGVYSQNILHELVTLLRIHDRTTVYTSHPGAFSERIPNNVVINGTAASLQPKFGKRAGFARFFWNQLVFPFKLQQQDLVYCPTHHGYLCGPSKQVVTIHDLLAIKFPTQYRLQYYYFKYFLPLLLRNAAAVIADSENTRRDVHSYYRIPLEKIHVVYSAIAQDFKPAGRDALQRVREIYGLSEFVFIIGASYPHKNISRAIKAFAQLRGKVPRAELVVAGGRKEYLKVLEQEARDLDIEGVKFLGYVPQQDIPLLYSAAYALLYPSLYEGFGLPPLEAMACGCPVIVSNTSSLPEICGDAAYYVDPYSIESIAEGLFRVVSNEKIREALRQKGMEQAKRFSWKKAAEGVYGVLDSVHRSSLRMP